VGLRVDPLYDDLYHAGARPSRLRATTFGVEDWVSGDLAFVLENSTGCKALTFDYYGGSNVGCCDYYHYYSDVLYSQFYCGGVAVHNDAVGDNEIGEEGNSCDDDCAILHC